jgi:hypothetical protein
VILLKGLSARVKFLVDTPPGTVEYNASPGLVVASLDCNCLFRRQRSLKFRN